MNRARESKGIPTGGQFTTAGRDEADINLAADEYHAGIAAPELTELNEHEQVMHEASCTETSPGRLADLAGVDDGLPRHPRPVRLGVAQNPSTPVDVLEQMAADEHDEEFYGAFARNPSTPASVLIKQAGTPSMNIRALTAGHPNADVAVIEKVIASSRERVDAATRTEAELRHQGMGRHAAALLAQERDVLHVAENALTRARVS